MFRVLVLILTLLLLIPCLCLGQTWHSPQRLTYTPDSSRLPKIAADSNNTVHVVWMDDFKGNYEIYYKNCTAGGTGTWSALKRLTWTANSSEYPTIAVDANDIVHVVWCEEVSYGNRDLYHKSSLDGGMTWGTPNRLNWSTGDSVYPVLVMVGVNNLRVFYIDETPGNWEIYCLQWSFEGWGGTQRLTWTSGDSRHPYAAIDYSNDIHVVWSDMTGSDYELCHKKSTDYGTTWSVRTRVTYSSEHSENPFFDFDPAHNIMRLAWNEGSCGSRRVCFKNRHASTGEFYGFQSITFRSIENHNPVIAATSANCIHIVYEGDPTGNYELYHKKSGDGGVTWTAPFRLTWNSGETRSAKMIVSGLPMGLRLVYNDSISNNVEIYFRWAEISE